MKRFIIAIKFLLDLTSAIERKFINKILFINKIYECKFLTWHKNNTFMLYTYILNI